MPGAKMWKVVLCLCAATWSLGEAQETRNRSQQTVNQMAKEVVDALKEILDVDLKMALPGGNVTYKTKFSFDRRGMGPLYNSTKRFVDLIARSQAYPEGVVTVSDGHLYVAPLSKNWSKWLSHYLGPVAIICAALLFALILPLAGLFWCCCYWCRVGCRRRPFDGAYDSWIRALLAILLICLLTLFLLGLVCVFTAETHVNDNLGGVTRTYRSLLQDALLFVNTAKDQANFLLETCFYDVKDRLLEMIKDVLPVTLRVLNDASNLRSLSTLNRLVQQLDDVRDNLAAVHNLTNALRMRAVDLNSGLRKVKNQLLQTLSRCDHPKCVALHNKYKISQLDTEIQYSQMLDQYFPTIPDVSGLLANITRLASSDLKEEIVDSSKVLRSLQRSLQSVVDERMPAVHNTIAGVGDKLKGLADQIRYSVGNVTAKLQKHLDNVQVIQDTVDEYGVYRQYLGMAAALCLLLMVALLAWGLLVGVCGERPEVYGAHGCGTKASGARSLLCGVAVVFTLGGFVAVVFALNFAVGVLTQRFVCDPLTLPLGNRLFRDVDAMVDLERTLYGERRTNFPSLTSVLVQCHRNFTVYEVLRMQRVLDLENLPVVISPTALMAELISLGYFPETTTPDTTTTEPDRPRMDFSPDSSLGQKLKQLAESGLADFDFERIRSALDTNLTSLELDGLARQLNSTAASLARPQWAAEARALQRAAADLDALNRRVLAPMLRDQAALRQGMPNLPDLPAAALGMVGQHTAAALDFLADNAARLLQMVLQKLVNLIAEKLSEYVKHALFYVRYDVGRCGPLSVVFNATRDSLCLKVVEPMHGYWMALGWCLLLLVPLLLVARRLAELYMQVDPYPGPLAETEYLYDAYADRDNVPLANAYKAEKRAGREGREGREGRDGREMRESRELRARRGGEGRAGGAGGAGGAARPDSPLAPPLDAYHARRYTDMAPKHWEEGPPRYHGPTEYERPPPYYYPGPNDRQ